MKCSLAAVAVLVFALSAGSAGQSRNTGLATSAAPAQATPGLPDVNATLADLKQAAEDTQNDLAKLRINKWGKNTDGKEAEKTVLSLQRNLAGALPELVTQVRNSHGSVAASFKLYDDLSVLCETLDPLVAATETYGKKEEYGPLADDFSRLTTIRRRLAAYVEARAAFIETRVAALESKANSTVTASAIPHAPRPSENMAPGANKPRTIETRAVQPASTNSGGAPAANKPKVITDNGPSPSASTASGNTQLPKKIVIDDNVSDEKPVKKKATLQRSNL
jgi:hypothetical protein